MNTSSWSWFEIGKMIPSSSSSSSSESDPIERGPTLAHNAIAGQSWQDFHIAFHVDEGQSRSVDQELRDWITGLRRGERVVLIPMARYSGWQCRVLKAWIEVEVEVWY